VVIGKAAAKEKRIPPTRVPPDSEIALLVLTVNGGGPSKVESTLLKEIEATTQNIQYPFNTDHDWSGVGPFVLHTGGFADEQVCVRLFR
jgi:hypothetical protein